MLREKFSASQFLPDVRRYGVTFFNTVGRALGYILATPPTVHDRDHSLRTVLAPEASPRDSTEFAARFGARVVSGYGSSEGAIVLLPVSTPGALGRPPPGSDIAVVDPDTGEERPSAVYDGKGRLRNPEQAIGEIVRRDGAGAFEGYYRNSKATTERTRGGWFWSGDLGYRDRSGTFFFAGRAGDWLRVDSENFAAAPVERILARFPVAASVAVYAVPDPQSGDQVMATFELRPGNEFEPAVFAAFLAGQDDLGPKWAPRFVRITSAMPVTGNDKLDKRPLRAAAWQTGEPVWWHPPGAPGYRRFTAADASALVDSFAAHGRLALLPGR
ncbi:MAG: AMP-binding protein [Mycobacteriales bacterium]